MIYDDAGEIVLDPDREVQQSIRLVFEWFGRLRSAWQVVRQLRQDRLRLPVRLRSGPQAGENLWVDATLTFREGAVGGSVWLKQSNTGYCYYDFSLPEAGSR